MGTVLFAWGDEKIAGSAIDSSASPAEVAYRDLIFKGDLLLSVLRREALVGETGSPEASDGKAEELHECPQVVDRIAADYVAAIEQWREEIEQKFGPLPSPRAAGAGRAGRITLCRPGAP